MSTIKKSSTRRSDDTMDDDSDDKDTKRKSRNLSEKKRRDQFNLLVNELNSMVATGNRKMDKSTVLKSTISFLKNHNEIALRSRVNEIQENWKPNFLTNEEFTHLVLEAVDGFIVVFSVIGQIFYASESITSLLGHLPNEVLGMTIYEMINEEEHNTLYNILMGPSMPEGQISFSCHLKRGGIEMKQQPLSYELVHFVGYFRSDEDMVQGDNRYSGYSGEGDTRLVFVGTGRVHTPQLIREMPLVDSSKSEFTSRHSLEWKFLFLDHRAPPIIGYLPFELLGTSGYDYYHIDDLDNVANCHQTLMHKGEGTSCYYRFLTKGQQWIWLQTRFYITYHQWNSKPEFIVCTHRVVSYIDVMKNKLNDDEPTSSTHTIEWSTNKNSSSTRLHGPGSDCTSISADSPNSRHSTQTPHSIVNAQQQTTIRVPANSIVDLQQSKQLNQNKTMVQPQLHVAPPPPPPPSLQIVQSEPFLEQQQQQQYVAAIPMQPVMAAGFAPTATAAVLSPLPPPPPSPMENVLMQPAQNQIQLDLQRKHAELQAMIGQQQAELRRVSEQLLMAKLGLLPVLQQSQLSPVLVPISTTTNVSSTTTAVPAGLATAGASPPIIVPVSIALSVQQQQQQQQQQEEDQQQNVYNPPSTDNAANNK